MLSIPEQGTMKRYTPHLNIVTTSGGEKLFLELKKIRKSLADQASVPPYVIFPDKSLREMAEIKPCDEQTFRNVNGVGDIKLEKYGTVFISAIQKYSEENGNDTPKPDAAATPESGDTLEQIYKLNQEISDLNDKLKELTVLKNSLLDQVVKTGIKQQGKYVLQSSSVSVRQLNLEAFKQLYPQVFMEIGSVKISDADRVLGKAEVTELCTLKELIIHKVVEM
jgi:ATP-dependent DNA helicase RecQ